MALREINENWNKCLSNMISYSLGGAAFGLIASLFLFKRRTPAIAYFTGLGGGYSYVQCEKEFTKVVSN
jgi:Domain of unknown function (DUF543)